MNGALFSTQKKSPRTSKINNENERLQGKDDSASCATACPCCLLAGLSKVEIM